MRIRLFFCVLLIFFVAAMTAEASSPDEWEKYYKEVKSKCTKASGLKKAQVIGEIIMLGDDVGFNAVLVRGRYPQPHMKNAEGNMLCLFNKKTRQAQCTEANQWFPEKP